ncbi:MAG: agmatinase [Candidatus Marinimicrobia bacterium]|nr:agmatinase [Candidatus Neomarinimicrobiota bacterium]
MLSILGIPFDENSSFLKGSAKAPQKIIEAFSSDSSNAYSENGFNCRNTEKIKILDNLELPYGELAIEKIRTIIKEELEKSNHVLSIGGDHSITFPIIEAFSAKYDSLNILHFDAHPDLYDDFDNNPFSHASPFARIMENNLVKRLVQIGIRTLNDHQIDQVNRFGVEVIEMKDFDSDLVLQFTGPVYISLDLDGLDPAYAPGVSHPEPGGLSTRNIINIIHSLKGQVIGGDIVEYNPDKDINDITATTGAKLMKELIGKIMKS